MDIVLLYRIILHQTHTKTSIVSTNRTKCVSNSVHNAVWVTGTFALVERPLVTSNQARRANFSRAVPCMFAFLLV